MAWLRYVLVPRIFTDALTPRDEGILRIFDMPDPRSRTDGNFTIIEIDHSDRIMAVEKNGDDVILYVATVEEMGKRHEIHMSRDNCAKIHEALSQISRTDEDYPYGMAA